MEESDRLVADIVSATLAQQPEPTTTMAKQVQLSVEVPGLIMVVLVVRELDSSFNCIR